MRRIARLLTRARGTFRGSVSLDLALVVATGIAAGATAGLLPSVVGHAVAAIGGDRARPATGLAAALIDWLPRHPAALVSATVAVTALVIGLGVLAARLSTSFAAELASALRIELVRVVLSASPRESFSLAEEFERGGPSRAPKPERIGATPGAPGGRSAAALQLAIARETSATAEFLVSTLLGLPQTCVTLAVLTVELAGRGATVVLLGGGALFVVSRLVVERASRRTTGARLELSKADTAVFAELQELLGSIEELRLFGARASAVETFAHRAREAADARRGLATAMAAAGQVRAVFGATSPLLVLAGLALGRGAAEPGEVATLLLYVPLLLGRLEALDGVRQGFVERAPSLAAIEALLALPEAPSRRADARHVSCAQISGTIEFERVSFTPPGAPAALLDGVSFRVPAGAIVGICGASGSGKSTLLRLLLRLDDPDEGRILLDGIDLRELEPDLLPSLFGVVRQTSQPLERSVRHHLALGLEPPPDEARMREALAMVGLGDLAEGVGARGLDTVVRRQPPNFSGGELRRLVLARVVLGDAPIRVLDEPEAGLPSAMAEEVLGAVMAAASGRTHVVVTHAPDLLDSDFNVLFVSGRVAAVGSHAELLASSAAYRALLSERRGA